MELVPVDSERSDGVRLTECRSESKDLEAYHPVKRENGKSESGKEVAQWTKQGEEALITTVSAFYGKLLVVLGVALAITEAIAEDDAAIKYDAFYLYLYFGSIAYLFYVYVSHLKEQAIKRVSGRDKSVVADSPGDRQRRPGVPARAAAWSHGEPEIRYGSFYLRVGVAAFGFGSMIYSMLAFGQYFERNTTAECDNILVAITPVVRTTFIVLQMVFVFANNGKFLGSPQHSIVSRFGLMHMLATNLCKWLYVVVQEAKSDIINSANKSSDGLEEARNGSSDSCWKSQIVASVMRDVGPYLFPCTVEYSLLCAVILATMWRTACADLASERRVRKRSGLNVIYARSISQFSVDLAGANKGLFAGLLAAALSILSLLLFFELSARPQLLHAALIQADVWEAALYASSTAAAVGCLVAVKSLAHRPDHRRLELEHALLFVSHGGLLLYLVFQLAGVYMDVDVAADAWHVMKVLTPVSALVQSCCQTLLVVDAWRRACSSPHQLRRKPGRQLVTFLVIANMCMWAVNRLLNNRPESHPAMVRFYGTWPWTIITHVCVPLVMCYRFQSSVCLYEIWIHVYKMH